MRPILDGGADARHFVYFHRLHFSFCYLRTCEKMKENNFFFCGKKFQIDPMILPSVVRLFSRFPSGAILVGVTCLNLFMWITSLSRRANALSQTSHMYLQTVGAINEIRNNVSFVINLRLFPGVNSHVDCQFIFACQSFAAHSALERLISYGK